MQTFLPYPDFSATFKALDPRRLSKQRVEAMQILNVLDGEGPARGWRSHPAVLMWRGYKGALMLYHDLCIREWVSRGYKNSMQYRIITGEMHGSPDMPWWLGDEDFHRSHRARLIEKSPEFYGPRFPGDRDFNGGAYLWPVNETRTFKII